MPIFATHQLCPETTGELVAGGGIGKITGVVEGVVGEVPPGG